MKNILVTGGAGFIGSNFVHHMLKNHDYNIINIDALTYAGNLDNLTDVEKDPRYTFIKADIRDRAALTEIFEKYDIDTVVNFAAESHVDRSITEPEIFLTTNVIGTQTLLDVAKSFWKTAPDDKYSREYNSPYSASKASADMVVRAYHETFGMPVNITRCSNNYGPYQFPEKLIPLMINNCKSGKALPVYGDGMQIRDWLHVSDHCNAIDTVLHKGVDGEVYNIGGNNEKANIEIVKLIIKTLGKSEDLIQYVKDRPGHDRRYAIDNTKITTQLGWAPKYTFEQGIAETIDWYQNHEEWMEKITSGAYMNYYDNMYTQAEK